MKAIHRLHKEIIVPSGGHENIITLTSIKEGEVIIISCYLGWSLTCMGKRYTQGSGRVSGSGHSWKLISWEDCLESCVELEIKAQFNKQVKALSLAGEGFELVPHFTDPGPSGRGAAGGEGYKRGRARTSPCGWNQVPATNGVKGQVWFSVSHIEDLHDLPQSIGQWAKIVSWMSILR